MATIHPDVMPIELQCGLLGDFDELASMDRVASNIDATESAMGWFKQTVSALSGVEPENFMLSGLYTDAMKKRRTNNCELHVDNELSPTVTKFVLTVCQTPFASTLFFPSATFDDVNKRPIETHSLFDRDSQTQLLSPKSRRKCFSSYRQAINGQIASFNLATDVHAAAPLPQYAKKILLFASVQREL